MVADERPAARTRRASSAPVLSCAKDRRRPPRDLKAILKGNSESVIAGYINSTPLSAHTTCARAHGADSNESIRWREARLIDEFVCALLVKFLLLLRREGGFTEVDHNLVEGTGEFEGNVVVFADRRAGVFPDVKGFIGGNAERNSSLHVSVRPLSSRPRSGWLGRLCRYRRHHT